VDAAELRSAKASAIAPGAPRVLRIALGRMRVSARGESCTRDSQACELRAWLAAEEVDGVARAALQRIGSWSGSALALALLHQERRGAGPNPLVLAVGECVREALPTAARASVLGRAALTGRLAEGQIGGELGARLASVADALVLHGRAPTRCGLLLIEADGSARLEERLELAGLSAAACWRALESELGEAALLRVGPAGERGIPFANLASGGEHPSFTGRGGLGASFAALGLKALAIRAPSAAPQRAGELAARLARSPRLQLRASSGTLELYGVLGARGELSARNHAHALDAEQGHALAREAEGRARERSGCRACPTPCGWVFERAQGAAQRAHFGASYALGANLGLERFEDSLELLAAADEAGLDARELGGVLALWSRAQELGARPGPSAFGSRARLLELVQALVDANRDAHGDTRGAELALGVQRLARRLGLEHEAQLVRGQATRPETSLAARLAQHVLVGAPDPLRATPFPSELGPQWLRLCTELRLPAGAADPAAPLGKGRLVWWHENLLAAVDASGFCAFSAGALLADELCTLDELAQSILPSALRDAALEPDWAELAPGERLLAAGASIALLRRIVDERLAAADRGARERSNLAPPLDPPELAHAELAPEYRRWRGVDERGRPQPAALAALGSARFAPNGRARELGLASEPRAHEHACSSTPQSSARAIASDSNEPRALGRVHLRGLGPIARALGDGEVELELPARARDVLAVAARDESARALLFDGERPRPALYRGGQPLDPLALCRAGDRIDLVLALSGG